MASVESYVCRRLWLPASDDYWRGMGEGDVFSRPRRIWLYLDIISLCVSPSPCIIGRQAGPAHSPMHHRQAGRSCTYIAPGLALHVAVQRVTKTTLIKVHYRRNPNPYLDIIQKRGVVFCWRGNCWLSLRPGLKSGGVCIHPQLQEIGPAEGHVRGQG